MNPVLARSYVAVTEQPGQPASRMQLEMLEARYRWAAAHARGKDVLEAGCGTGIGLPMVADVAWSVQAGDVDANNLRAAAEACAGRCNIELRAFHAENLPFADESFDLLLLFEAIYYLADVRRFFKEARRVLRPGGILLIATVNPAWTGFNPSPFRTRYLSAGDLLTELAAAGFTARVQGAFQEATGWMAGATGMVRRAAVALKLVPRTLRGKALLKRIFYGPLKPLPQRLAHGPGRSQVFSEMDCTAATTCRVLYVTAQKA